MTKGIFVGQKIQKRFWSVRKTALTVSIGCVFSYFIYRAFLKNVDNVDFSELDFDPRYVEFSIDEVIKRREELERQLRKQDMISNSKQY